MTTTTTTRVSRIPRPTLSQITSSQLTRTAAVVKAKIFHHTSSPALTRAATRATGAMHSPSSSSSSNPVFFKCCVCDYQNKHLQSWVKCDSCTEREGWSHIRCAGFGSKREAEASSWVCNNCASKSAAPLITALAASPIAHTATRAYSGQSPQIADETPPWPDTQDLHLSLSPTALFQSDDHEENFRFQRSRPFFTRRQDRIGPSPSIFAPSHAAR